MRTCKKCGCVHFGVTRQFAENAVREFNDYYETLTPEKQQDYYKGKKAHILSYEVCFNCGEPNTNFRASKPSDCRDGSTIQPIIEE